MQTFAVDYGLIESWGQFSGDLNPIHFDRERARRLGAPDVVAHGKLVLLIVMDAVSRATSASDAGSGWWALRSRMRHPVVAGYDALLSIRAKGEGTAFSVESPDGRKLVTGSLTELLEAPSDADPVTGLLSLSAGLVTAETDRLRTTFGWVAEPWVIIDAIAFTHYLRSGPLRQLMRGVVSRGGCPEGSPETFVVQTSHDVTFDREVFARADLRDFGLDIEMPPPESVPVPGGVTSECRLIIRRNGSVVMRTSIGLFIARAAGFTSRGS